MVAKHIFLVDAHAASRSKIAEALSQAGYKVTTSDDGEHALMSIVMAPRECSKSIDLLITDSEMPGLTGLELIDQLRMRGIVPPTIIMPDSEGADTNNDMMRDGCAVYLKKSGSIHQMLEQIGELLERRTMAAVY